MREAAPLPVMIVAGLIIIAAMATFGALWSGSEAGTAFAEAATSSYDSGWLPWAGAISSSAASAIAPAFAQPCVQST